MGEGLANGASSAPEKSSNGMNFEALIGVAQLLINTVKISSPAPVVPFPTILPTGGVPNPQTIRPGLSARDTASRIISRQSAAGAIPGPLPDGQESVTEQMERIRIEEIFRAIQQDMRITTVNTIPIVLGAPPGTAGGTGVAQ